MLRRLRPLTTGAALLLGLAAFAGQPALAQNPAAARADMLAGKRVAEGVITHIDTYGRQIVVDGRAYLLAAGIAPDSLHVGEAVTVAFEASKLGGVRRALRISPR